MRLAVILIMGSLGMVTVLALLLHPLLMLLIIMKTTLCIGTNKEILTIVTGTGTWV